MRVRNENETPSCLQRTDGSRVDDQPMQRRRRLWRALVLKSLGGLTLAVGIGCCSLAGAAEPSGAFAANLMEPANAFSTAWLNELDPPDSSADDVDPLDDFDDPAEDYGSDDPGKIDEDDMDGRLSKSIYGDRNARVPSVEGGRFLLPKLEAPTTDMTEIGNGRLPDNFRGNAPTPVMALPESLFDRGLPASWTVKHWAAPNTFSLPRYFEDRMLERHGHERFPCATPLISGARFFATIPMLPYLATVRPPCDCEYTMGYYRVGSCAPRMLQRPPYEKRAVIAEAAAIAGAAVALP
ncbi:hypothetical protein [Crateriforma spongiae]|uniref:hypothetical protein n=1 Tax=Crateriforma spongiae TaxID=2724528 RepID=UPI00144692B5|nr:hypothetical protein [Crateriforma spongiae]